MKIIINLRDPASVAEVVQRILADGDQLGLRPTEKVQLMNLSNALDKFRNLEYVRGWKMGALWAKHHGQGDIPVTDFGDDFDAGFQDRLRAEFKLHSDE